MSNWWNSWFYDNLTKYTIFFCDQLRKFTILFAERSMKFVEFLCDYFHEDHDRLKKSPISFHNRLTNWFSGNLLKINNSRKNCMSISSVSVRTYLNNLRVTYLMSGTQNCLIGTNFSAFWANWSIRPPLSLFATRIIQHHCFIYLKRITE